MCIKVAKINSRVPFLCIQVFQGLRDAGYTNLIPAGTFTNFINNRQYDNIWVRKDQWGYDDESQLQVECDVIRDGLTNDRNEPVSDHCPLWASIPYRNTAV